MKKNKRGFTLLEIAVAISVSTVVFGGAAFVFLTFNKMSTNSKKEYDELNEAKYFATLLDRTFDDNIDKTVEVHKSFIRSIENEDFFSIQTGDINKTYFFKNNYFSYRVSDNEETIYEIKNQISISINNEGENLHKFTISYGDSLNNNIYFYKAF